MRKAEIIYQAQLKKEVEAKKKRQKQIEIIRKLEKEKELELEDQDKHWNEYVVRYKELEKNENINREQIISNCKREKNIEKEAFCDLKMNKKKEGMVLIKQLDQGKKEQLAHPTKEFDAKLNKSRLELEEVRNKINEVSRTEKKLDSKSKEVLTLSNDEKFTFRRHFI